MQLQHALSIFITSLGTKNQALCLEYDEAAIVLELEVDGAKCRGGKGRKQH